MKCYGGLNPEKAPNTTGNIYWKIKRYDVFSQSFTINCGWIDDDSLFTFLMTPGFVQALNNININIHIRKDYLVYLICVPIDRNRWSNTPSVFILKIGLFKYIRELFIFIKLIDIFSTWSKMIIFSLNREMREKINTQTSNWSASHGW